MSYTSKTSDAPPQYNLVSAFNGHLDDALSIHTRLDNLLSGIRGTKPEPVGMNDAPPIQPTIVRVSSSLSSVLNQIGEQLRELEALLSTP